MENGCLMLIAHTLQDVNTWFHKLDTWPFACKLGIPIDPFEILPIPVRLVNFATGGDSAILDID